MGYFLTFYTTKRENLTVSKQIHLYTSTSAVLSGSPYFEWEEIYIHIQLS